MGMLTVGLTTDEERLLSRRSRGAGMRKATFVRQLIREGPFVTGADVVKGADRRLDDARLRISRKCNIACSFKRLGTGYEDHWRKWVRGEAFLRSRKCAN